MSSSTPSVPSAAGSAFDWPLAYEAERLVGGYLEAFLLRNGFARKLAERIRDETGTDFFEWVDHLVLTPDHADALRAAGFVEEKVSAPSGTTVLGHPRAMMPRVLLQADGGKGGVPTIVSIRPESLVDFLAAHDLNVAITGAFGARLWTAPVHAENGTTLFACERLGFRGFVASAPEAKFVSAVVRVRELFRTRKRDFAHDTEGVAHALARLDEVLGLVDRDAACELFFAEERVFWEAKNRAADRKSTRLNSSHVSESRMPSSA